MRIKKYFFISFVLSVLSNALLFGALTKLPSAAVVSDMKAFTLKKGVTTPKALDDFTDLELQLFFNDLHQEVVAVVSEKYNAAQQDEAAFNVAVDTELFKLALSLFQEGATVKLFGGLAGLGGYIYVPQGVKTFLRQQISKELSVLKDNTVFMEYQKIVADAIDQQQVAQKMAEQLKGATGHNHNLLEYYIQQVTFWRSQYAELKAKKTVTVINPLKSPKKPLTPVTPTPVVLSVVDQKKLDGQKKSLTALRAKVAATTDSDTRTALLQQIDEQLKAVKPIDNTTFSTLTKKINSFLTPKVVTTSAEVLAKQKQDLQTYRTKVDVATSAALKVDKEDLLKKIDTLIANNTAKQVIKTADFSALTQQVSAFEKRAGALATQQAALQALQQKIDDEAVLATVASKDTAFAAKKTALEQTLNKYLTRTIILKSQDIQELDTDIMALIAEGKQLKAKQLAGKKPIPTPPAKAKPQPATVDTKPISTPATVAPTPSVKTEPKGKAVPLNPAQVKRLLNTLAESLAVLAQA